MNVSGSDRMSRLAAHLLEQQSFYPMFPAPEKLHPQVYITRILLNYVFGECAYFFCLFVVVVGFETIKALANEKIS